MFPLETPFQKSYPKELLGFFFIKIWYTIVVVITLFEV